MRITSLALILLVVGAPGWACGGDDGSDPSEVGGRGGESGDGDGDTNTNGDGDPGDGDGDGDGTGGGDGDGDRDGSGGGTGGDGGDPENCDGCLIDERCYPDGAGNPENSCQTCDAPASDWSNSADGESCGKNGSCDAGTCACTEGWTGNDCTTCVVYVKTDGDDDESGLSWDGALADINTALEFAASRRIDEELDSCQVWVVEGTYRPGTELTSTFQLQEHVELYGGFAGTETLLSQRDWEAHETILSGDLAGNDAAGDLEDPPRPVHRADNVYHVVTGGDDALLDGLTVRSGGNSEADGQEDRQGSGLLNLGVAPTVKNCTFEENYARWDGTAIYTAGSDSVGTISESRFVGNVGVAGSTVFFDASDAQLDRLVMQENVNGWGAVTSVGSEISVTRSEFVANTGGNGAGISAREETNLVVQDCRFDDNVSSDHGGAVWLLRSTAVMEHATFNNNSAVNLTLQNIRGGALTAVDGQTRIANSIFKGNSAQGGSADFGGAIENWGGSLLSIVNSSFIDNMALVGSAIRNDGEGTILEVVNCSFFGNDPSGTNGTLSNFESHASISNSIFWGGSVPEIRHVDSTTTVTSVVHSDVQGGYTGEGNLDADPQFVDAESGDLHLTSASPVFDQGDSDSLPKDILDLDQDGDVDEPLPVDLDGNDRVVGSSVDMGAYESAE